MVAAALDALRTNFDIDSHLVNPSGAQFDAQVLERCDVLDYDVLLASSSRLRARPRLRGVDDVLLVAVTEKRTPAEIDRLAEVLAEVAA